MRSLLGGLDTLDLELDPVTLFEMMDAPIESQQEFESVLGCLIIHIMSGNDNKVFHLPSQWAAVQHGQLFNAFQSHPRDGRATLRVEWRSTASHHHQIDNL